MKKLSVLIALALCLTIGGAYAAWSYYATVPAHVDGTVNVQIEAAETVQAGSLALGANKTVTIDVNNAGNYVAELVGSGDLVVTFTATSGMHTDDPIYQNGLEIPVAINVAGFGLIDGTNAAISAKVASFKIMPKGTDVTGTNNLVWDGSNGVFTCTITAAKVVSCLQLGGGSVTLPTPAAHETFSNALTTGTVTVVIGDPAINN